MNYQEKLERYDAIVAQCSNIQRKGKTVPYTSANGHMFSLLNKDGELGFRYSKEEQKSLMEKHNTTVLMSHGATMRGYIKITEDMFKDRDMLVNYLQKSFDYVMSLPPK